MNNINSSTIRLGSNNSNMRGYHSGHYGNLPFNNFSDNKTRGLGDKNKHEDNVHNRSNKKTKASDIVDLSNDIDDDVKYFVPNLGGKKKKIGSNSNIVLVYPMGEEDLDCITIRECDVNRLDKSVYLNDSLIDLQ